MPPMKSFLPSGTSGRLSGLLVSSEGSTSGAGCSTSAATTSEGGASSPSALECLAASASDRRRSSLSDIEPLSGSCQHLTINGGPRAIGRRRREVKAVRKRSSNLRTKISSYATVVLKLGCLFFLSLSLSLFRACCGTWGDADNDGASKEQKGKRASSFPSFLPLAPPPRLHSAPPSSFRKKKHGVAGVPR